QRPWRPDGELVADIATQNESQAGVMILNYLEQHHDHSTDRINHYGIASDFCRDLQRTRTRCELMMMMGHEFLLKKEYHRCIILMTHVLKEFGRDKLTELLFVVGDTGLKASWCDGDVTAYLSFLIFLLKKDFAAKLGEKRRQSLWTNFVTALQKNVPQSLDENSNLSCKEDGWMAAMGRPYVSYVVVHKEPFLDAAFYFVSETFRAGSRAEVRVVLKNSSEFAIAIQKCGVVIIIADYNTELALNVTLQPGDSHELSLFFPLMVRDTGKIIQIQMGYVDIGKPDASVLLHYSALIESNPYLWNDGKKDVKKQIIAKIDPMLPLLTPKVAFEFFPMLTNCVQKVDISWTNTGTQTYTTLNLVCRLECPELEDLYINDHPDTPNARLRNMGVTIEADELSAGESEQVTLYINSRKPRSDIQLTTKAKYIDGNGQIVTNDSVEPIEMIDPFGVSWEFLNTQFETIQEASPNEPFMIKFTVKNLSQQTLHVRKMEFNLTEGSAFVETGNAHQLPHFMIFKAKEVYQFVNAYKLQFATQLPVGTLCIQWLKYRKQVDGYCSMSTEFTVNSLPLSRCHVFVETIVSARGMGELKKPMPIKYAITNCTEKVLDLSTSIESSDSFMNAGPKKTNLKLISGGTAYFQYVLFPLKTGLLLTPRLVFEHANAAGDNRLAPVIQRNVVKNIFVARAEGEGREHGSVITSALEPVDG
ncbi:Trafficking protein particle complex subunit 11, partial [Orchesella cincta]